LATEVHVAREAGASIFSFNVKNDSTVVRLAQEEGVSLIGNDVIYRLIDESKGVFAQFLPARPVEVVHGTAVVQAMFDIGGMSSRVAGLRVDDGRLYKEKTVNESTGKKSIVRYRVIRDGEVITADSVKLSATSLKVHKDDVDEVGRGIECGLSLSAFSDYEKGDIIECFSIEMKNEFV
jgi:translation initiation factor IF-2